MADNQPNLPLTNARLATSIKIYAIKDDLDLSGDLSSIASSIASGKYGKAVPIAAITRLEEVNNRPATPRYEIDADSAGEIVERIPQLVDRTLRVERIVLYSSDAIKAIADVDADLINQTKPFTIAKVEYNVSKDANGNVVKKPQAVTLYLGCWFTSNPKSYSVSGNIHIIQNVDIGYAKRRYYTI
jgi:hypothetical protein